MNKKCFPARLDQLYPILNFIQQEGHQCRFSSSLFNQLLLAVEEAVVNIIGHAYPDQTDGTIEIEVEEYKKDKTGICVTIKDQGIPFNPIQRFHAASHPGLPRHARPIEQTELGGYGISLLISLMDGVDYQRINDENILYLIKYF